MSQCSTPSQGRGCHSHNAKVSWQWQGECRIPAPPVGVAVGAQALPPRPIHPNVATRGNEALQYVRWNMARGSGGGGSSAGQGPTARLGLSRPP